jgi:hypothetical protein
MRQSRSLSWAPRDDQASDPRTIVDEAQRLLKRESHDLPKSAPKSSPEPAPRQPKRRKLYQRPSKIESPEIPGNPLDQQQRIKLSDTDEPEFDSDNCIIYELVPSNSVEVERADNNNRAKTTQVRKSRGQRSNNIGVHKGG